MGNIWIRDRKPAKHENEIKKYYEILWCMRRGFLFHNDA